jgi:hypothetical protein
MLHRIRESFVALGGVTFVRRQEDLWSALDLQELGAMQCFLAKRCETL